MYVIQSGSVLCQIDHSVTSLVGRRLAAAAEKHADNLQRQPRCITALLPCLLSGGSACAVVERLL